MQTGSRPFAIVTGASQGIGFDVALLCARSGYDLMLVAEESMRDIVQLAAGLGVEVQALHLNLSDEADLEELYSCASGRHIDLLMVDAHEGIDTALMYLIYRIGMAMRRAGRGKIFINGLVEGSPADFAARRGPKSPVDSFLDSLRIELENSGVSLSCVSLQEPAPDKPVAAKSGQYARLH